ncbi:HEAT repeat domain-containing protein [Metabacillus idriensis]|uniref:HEAT repeat domain-containing protein n=1 Tax=Metabacillus idriensis TaxID=324768 RepID=UPI003D2B14A7
MNILSVNQLFFLLISSMGVLIFLLLYLTAAKLFRKQKRKKMDESKERYRLPLYHYLNDQAEFADNKMDAEAFSELLQEFAVVLDSETVKERLRNAAEKSLTKWLRKHLYSGKWSFRMNALYIIEDLRLFHFLDDIEKQYQVKKISASEEAQMLKIFAVSGEPGFISKLNMVRNDLSDFTFFTIFQSLPAEQLKQCILHYPQLKKPVKYNLINLIGEKQLFEHNVFLEDLLYTGDKEEKLRSLRAISDMGRLVHPEKIAPFLKSSSWQERMMAVKVIGALRIDAYKMDVKLLLEDREYLVRMESARSLVKFKDGRDELIDVINRSEDGFAKDMAIEWIEKERIYY